MKKVFYLVAASLLLTSCLENKVIEAYNEDFENVFGETDPLHTWKMVENQSVEVNLDKPSRVKIYVLIDNTYRLVADYENVSGTRTLSYDAPIGCEDIYVTVDGAPILGVNSRNGNQNTVSPPSVEVTENFLEFTYKQVCDFHNDGETLPEGKDNRNNVTSTGCKLVSAGSGNYQFYPIYWGGSYYHKYGFYYYDEWGIFHECKDYFYCNKVDDALQYFNNNVNDWRSVGNVTFVSKLFFPDPESGQTPPTYDDDDPVLRSKCYKIYIKPGTVFGFYVDVFKNSSQDSYIGRFYSDPDLNDANQTNNPFTAFAYLHRENDSNTYITLEDKEDFTDNDYNDFIFMMKGDHQHYEDIPVQYIYAVEDLGGANDFDFNDVVFSVSHIAGNEYATVQPLAAGGIYEAEIWFGDECYGEIHDMLGKPSNERVNTYNGDLVKMDPFKVNVGTNWSHAAYGKSGNGFSVKVNIPGKKDKVITTNEPGTGDAPQMLVLSENWMWPTERTRISEAYPRFKEWGENYTDRTWVSEHVDGLVVKWKE